MMEIIIAILIALGSITAPDELTPEFYDQNPEAIERATQIYDSGSYTIERTETGGVVVVTGVGV